VSLRKESTLSKRDEVAAEIRALAEQLRRERDAV
jgi:hypothetical protein